MSSPTVVAKPSLPLLKTPLSAGPMLPSELPRSPALKMEAVDATTPITPPSAYTDFLKALSPAVSTPLTAASTRSSFSFTDRTGHLTPISQASSAASSRSSSADGIKTTVVSAPLCPPTPFVRPSPARTPSGRTPTTLRKLRIPASAPHSAPASTLTPGLRTPATGTPRSTRSPYSPTSWYMDGKTKTFGAPLSASPRHVSVRQVVTRTVTYRSTPLEPAPRGKRRRIE